LGTLRGDHENGVEAAMLSGPHRRREEYLMPMFVITYHPKQSVTPADFPELNKFLDEEYIPVAESVDGVESVRVFNSFQGDLMVAMEAETVSTIQTIMELPDVGATLAKLFTWCDRTDADIWFERPTVQALYAGR
jgi:hypothetical protein